MAYICGVPRAQAMLLPECVEDFVGPNNPVRVIDAFVEGLHLAKLGFPLVDEGLPGARSYDPKLLLKLFIYGYLNRLRSSRELEKATYRNLEVIWLLRRLTPDHWTINAFRRTHRTRFQGVFREFNVLCGKLELFSKELVAIDGTFLKGVNNPSRNFTKAKVEKLLKEIDERTERYLATLETADQEAEGQGLGAVGGTKEAPAKPLRAQLEQLEKERQKYAELLAELSAEPGQQLSLTDPESRLLHKGSQSVVGYNAQIAVEGEHHLIVAQEVTRDPNDTQQLAPMAEAACAALELASLIALGDGGFYNLAQIQRCEAQGIVTYVPAPKPARVAGDGTYPDTSFQYDAEADSFHCPQGEELSRHKDTQTTAGPRKVYYNTSACRHCPVREACTKGEYRRITVHEHAATAEAVRERMQRKPEIFARRKGLVEHCFGTLKFWMGHAAFLTRGLEMVRGEFSLSCLGYNLRRVLNLVSVPALLAALRGEVVPKTAVQGA
jgi:transposase